MTDKIGPTFTSELAAAGVSLDGLGIDCANGVIIATLLANPSALANATPDQISAVQAQLASAQAVLARHDPTRQPPPPPRQQLGTVFLGAVADLGWWGWMDQGAAAQVAVGKPLDGRYWQSIGKADLVLVTDAKLTRVARAAEAARVAASGQPAPAAPIITLGAAFDRGDAMTAA